MHLDFLSQHKIVDAAGVRTSTLDKFTPFSNPSCVYEIVSQAAINLFDAVITFQSMVKSEFFFDTSLGTIIGALRIDIGFWREEPVFFILHRSVLYYHLLVHTVFFRSL